MSDQTRVLIAHGGKHATNAQFESDSGVSYASVEPYAEPRVVCARIKNPRDLVRGDGMRYATRTGVQQTALDIELLLRGVSGGAGNGVSASYTTKLEYGWLLDSLFGANGSNGTGANITASNGAGATITVSDRTGFPVGNAVLFNNGTSLIAREVTASGSGAGILTLDRAFSGTATGVAYGSASWYLDASNSNHIHTAWNLQGDNWARKLYGCMGNMVLAIPNGGQMLSLRCALQGTKWGAGDSTAFSAPTVGNEIKAMSAILTLGTTVYNLIDGEIDLGLQPKPRQTSAGVNGLLGYQVGSPEPKMKARLQFGGTISGEADDTFLQTAQGETTYDLGLQLGAAVGAACYIRAPAADLNGDLDKADGFDILNMNALFTRPTTGHQVRFHLF